MSGSRSLDAELAAVHPAAPMGRDGPDELLAAVERRALADGAELGHAVSLHQRASDPVGNGMAEVLVQRGCAGKHGEHHALGIACWL